MVTVMEPSLDTFSGQIERHLKATNRPDEAAALRQQTLLARLLNLLIVQFVSTSELRVTEIERQLRERYTRNYGRVPKGRPQAFLTSMGAGRQALVADFEAIASHIGELSMNLQKGRCEGEGDPAEIKRLLAEFYTQLDEDCAKPPEATRSLAETLEDLESPGAGLSETYRHPDLFGQGPWSTRDFLRK